MVQENLFNQSTVKKEYDYSPDGGLDYYPYFFTLDESKKLFSSLLTTIQWQQDQINIMGKNIDIPRLTAWYGTNKKSYTYSGIKMEPHLITEDILYIKDKIESISSSRFNSVLLNQYRDGNDSVDWHSDDERELDSNADIASVSFGIERDFQVKQKTPGSKLENISLTNGSLVIMKAPFQEAFIHRIPKRPKLKKPRINLTFRVIL